MIKVSITKEQQKELEQFRSLATSKNSEKALMVLLSSERTKGLLKKTVLLRLRHQEKITYTDCAVISLVFKVR